MISPILARLVAALMLGILFAFTEKLYRLNMAAKRGLKIAVYESEKKRIKTDQKQIRFRLAVLNIVCTLLVILIMYCYYEGGMYYSLSRVMGDPTFRWVDAVIDFVSLVLLAFSGDMLMNWLTASDLNP